MKRLSQFALTILFLLPAHAIAQKLIEYVPMNSPIAVAVNPVTNMVYAANYNDATVSVMDGSSNAVVATISVGPGPFSLAVNPVTNLIYVSNSGTPQGTGMSIMVIDGSSNTVTGTLPLVTYPGFIAVNPTTNMVYFTDQYASLFVAVMDGSTNQVVAQVLVKEGGCCLYGMALNSVTNRLYLSIDTYTDNGSYIAVMDATRNEMTGKFTPPGLKFAGTLAVDTGLNRLYTSDDVFSELFVINGATDEAITTLPYFAESMAVDQTTHLLALEYDELTFIDGLNDEAVGGQVPFPVGTWRIYLAAGIDNNFYAGYDNYTNNNVTGSVGIYSGPQGD
jgi:YVTN family beta-propeller protein